MGGYEQTCTLVLCVVLPFAMPRTILPNMLPYDGQFNSQKTDFSLDNKVSNEIDNNELIIGSDDKLLYNDNIESDNDNSIVEELFPTNDQVTENANLPTEQPVITEEKRQVLAKEIEQNGKDFAAILDDGSPVIDATQHIDTKESARAETKEIISQSEIFPDESRRRDYMFLAIENILNQSKRSDSVIGEIQLTFRFSFVILSLMNTSACWASKEYIFRDP